MLILVLSYWINVLSKAALLKEVIFGGFYEAISEKFCGIFFFLVLVYWIKFGKIEERANQVLAHKKYYQ